MACKRVAKLKAMRGGPYSISQFRLARDQRNFEMKRYKLCIAVISCQMRVEPLLKEKNRGDYTNTHVVPHDGCFRYFLMCPALRSISGRDRLNVAQGCTSVSARMFSQWRIRENTDFAFPTRDKSVILSGALTDLSRVTGLGGAESKDLDELFLPKLLEPFQPPKPMPGAPHLARFSRDVGYHRC